MPHARFRRTPQAPPPPIRRFRRGIAIACGALVLAANAAVAQSPATDIYVAAATPGPRIAFESWRNVTARAGYDNQPGFTPDSRAILYTSEREGQTDIYRFDLPSGETVGVTGTPESEYSPTVMPGGARFSAVRVERDSTQRLWSFLLDGSDPRLVLEDVRPVGYHAWLGEDAVALFVLGDPPTLRIGSPGEGGGRIVAHDIGRSLQRVPGRPAVSFIHRDGGAARLRTLDPATNEGRDLVPPLPGAQDYAWTPAGVILMGSGSRLYAHDPLIDTGWRELADLAAEGIGDITRIAVSPDGSWIAVVGADGS